MGKEDNDSNSPQVKRRTRSSCSASGNDIVKTITSESYTPTLNDFVYGGDNLSLNELLSGFPARKIQISELLSLLGPLNSPMVPLHIYGGSSTGKTSIILHIFRHLSRPFVYVSCRTCYSPRILFESVLNQLFYHRRTAANSYSSSKRCEKPSNFVNILRDALVSVIAELKGTSGKLPQGNILYLIFDNLELIRNWDKSSSYLPFMFNLYDILKMPELGIIYVSNTSPDTFYSSFGYIEPIPVYFSEYTEEDLRQIFLRNQANRKLYSSFLDVVLKPFCRITRRVDELSSVFTSLFRKYCEPLRDLDHAPNEEMRRRLFSHFQPHIILSLNDNFSVSSPNSIEAESNKEKKHKGSQRNPDSVGDFAGLDFHMSTSAKYLLISAFLASRNPATLDASLFDSTGGLDNRKRKRKPSAKSVEQKEAAEQELLMKGPGTFPLERLLAIFQCISSAVDDSLDEEDHGNNPLRVQGGDGGLMCDVLMQLASLCNANFIIKGGSCPLEGSTRYRSTISEDLAMKVARSLKFPLPNYLYRR